MDRGLASIFVALAVAGCAGGGAAHCLWVVALRGLVR